MSKSVHEQWHVIHRDFIPEGQEYTAPHSGGLFHDFIPEGKRGIDMHGLTYDATPKPEREHELTADCWCEPAVVTVPADEPAGENLTTSVIIPEPKPSKKG